MELGEKLRQARLEAGLTQRQLCGDQITRNMLSLIENGAQVLHDRSVEFAREYGIRVEVLSAFTGEPGTIVGDLE